MDRDVLMHEMTERFQELYGQALDAIEQAPDGQWINASEFVVRDVFTQLMKESYEAALQTKVDSHPTATKAAFSPSKPSDHRSADASQQGLPSGTDSDRRR